MKSPKFPHHLRPPTDWGAVPLYVVALCAVMLVAASSGATSIPLSDTLAVVNSRLGFGTTPDPSTDLVVWTYRLPRVCLAAAAGAGLALSGLLMQTAVRNPLADPFMLGLTSGASLGAVLVITGVGFAAHGVGVVGAAFSAAMLTSVAVLTLGQHLGSLVPLRVILAGVAVNYLALAATNFVQLWATPNQLREVLFWSLGAVTGATWTGCMMVTCVVAISLFVAWALAGMFNALDCGDDHALALGVQVSALRWGMLGVVALVTGVVVSQCGGVGFVGLIIPHMVRIMHGVDHRIRVPLVACGGAIFLVLADWVSRMILAPAEIPLGIVTATVGAPFFLYLLKSRGNKL